MTAKDPAFSLAMTTHLVPVMAQATADRLA